MSQNDRYTSPLSERYASREMQYIFSPDMKFKTWRRLWIALAETERELPHTRFGNPRAEKAPNYVTYPDACTWLGALWFSKAVKNKDMQQRLKELHLILLSLIHI